RSSDLFFKMPPIDIQGCMRWKWPSAIGIFFQKNGLPEAVHFFQMFRPFIAYPCLKYRSQQFIFPHLPVKLIYQKFYIVKGFYVGIFVHTCKGKVSCK